MLKLFLCCIAVFVAVKASGDFVVLHSPNSVLFNGNEEVEQSLLKEVLAAALGFTVKLRGIWSGISITDPFSLPEAVVAVVIEGVDSLDIPKGKRFPLYVNEVEETTWQALRERLEERDNDNTLVRISLGDGLDALGQSALGELKPTPIDESSLRALNLRKEEDKKFLEEVQLLHAIAKKAPSAIKPDSKSDIYWLVISGLRPIFDAYGSNSTTSREALLLLNNALNVIHDAFIQAYEGQVLIVAFTNDASKVHHIRSVTQERQKREASEPGVTRLAKVYSGDYPVIFNILLWFGVVFVFSLLAICIAIAQMDPGRDSIIYRMTSNRMKKDN
ncbi:ATPase H(+)-transporting accessory protein 2 isoform X2 [Osmia lignaria lignaria]|uniref:ATPase H(+)-transporting accessory protein 2 isoform X2 n=1 Tax=Osmia lignaria lignaria TaxID=1437193 RepID=UPI001478776F|nr:ATPase H(+)-transporting accessory protein 2 isoform X2 [Osmia lignaria]